MNTTNPRDYRETVRLWAVIISLLAALVGPFLSGGQAAQPAAEESTKTKSVEQPEKDAMEVLEKIKTRLPSGWSIKSEKNIITVRRDKPIEWYGTISLPYHHDLAELKAKGFVHSGDYTIILEFFPPMSKAAMEKLIEENRRIVEQYNRTHPQPKNSKPIGLPKDVRDSMHHIPSILVESYSVLLIPFIRGPGMAFFNEQDKKECEGVEQSIHRLLKSDEPR